MKDISFFSDYYGKDFIIIKADIDVLNEIYLDVAKEKRFEPETIGDIDELIDTSHSFDHVAYHVEEFGKDHEKYKGIQHLF